jgi:hypothetical protein
MLYDLCEWENKYFAVIIYAASCFMCKEYKNYGHFAEIKSTLVW